MRLLRRVFSRWPPSSTSPFLFLILTLTVTFADPSAGQPQCFQLINSSACPAFNNYFIDPTDLQHTYTWFQNVTDTSSFDVTLTKFLSSTYYTTYFWQDQLDCGSALTNKIPPYARYTTSVWCTLLVQDTNSLSCNFQNNLSPPPLCQMTCLAWVNSVIGITNQTALCGNMTTLRNSTLAQNIDNCYNSQGLDGVTGNCVLGNVNEPNSCGFAYDTTRLCDFCSTTKTDSCCSSAQVIKLCSNSSLTSSSSSNSNGITLGPGAIAGIAVGSAVVAAVLGALIFLFAKKDRRQPYTKQGVFTGSGSTYYNSSPYAGYLNAPASSTIGQRDSESDIMKSLYASTGNHSEYFKVIHPYMPKMDDELHLHVNDVVQFIHSFDDGWALGINRSTNQKGAFPLVCIISITPEMAEELLLETANGNSNHGPSNPNDIPLVPFQGGDGLGVFYTQSPSPLSTPLDGKFPPSSPRANDTHISKQNVLTLTTTNLQPGPEPQPFMHNFLGSPSRIPHRHTSMRSLSSNVAVTSPVSPESGTPSPPSSATPLRQPSRLYSDTDVVQFEGKLYRSGSTDVDPPHSRIVSAASAYTIESTIENTNGHPSSQTDLIRKDR